MDGILSDLKRDLRLYSSSITKEPTSDWVDQQTIALLQQYPSGISKTVLLTELEHRWRSSLKRGENTGKLKQALSTMQLSLADVLIGELTKIDEYRCVIQADGVKCGMMVHRQLFDWTMFLHSVGVEALTGRTCMLTCCRLLNISPPLLLPTPLLLFVLRVSDPLEAFLVQDVFFVLHQAFVQSFVRPHIATRPTAVTGATYATAGNCDIPLPDNSQTLVLFAEVLGNSAVRQYNAGTAGAGAVSADYQLVTLRLHTESAIVSNVNSNNTSPCCVAYLILFDDQVSLSHMWRVGDLLQVYRPYLRANAEEETIFGSHRPGALHNPAHTMTYDVVQRADPGLCDHLPLAAGGAVDVHFMNYHLLYGSVTVISKIETMEEHTNMGSAVPAGLQTSGAGAGTGTGIASHSRLGPVLGRLLSASIVALARGSTGSEQEQVVELWLQLFSCVGAERAGGAVPDTCPWSVLRVRYVQHLHPALSSLVSFPGFGCNQVVGSVCHVLDQTDCDASMRCLPMAQAGQLVSISGLRSLHASVVSLKSHSTQHSVPPSGVLQYLLSACPLPSSGSDVAVLNCVFGDSRPGEADALFECDPADRASAAGPKRAGSAGEESDRCVSGVTITTICSLPALACSPSLTLPLSLKCALASMHVPNCGCIFVQASIQPLHPSVRLCYPPAVASGASTAIADPAAKRARTGDAASAPTAERDGQRTVLMGYQLMRLRDGTGEALCVIESNVLVLNGGPAAQHNEVQEVRHRLVNTTSSLYLDSSTGQLVRLQQSSSGTQSSGAVPAPPPGGQQQHFSILLSRIDDGVDSAVLRAIALSQRPGSTSSGHLPAFRIEAICDANPAALEALRLLRGNK